MRSWIRRQGVVLFFVSAALVFLFLLVTGFTRWLVPWEIAVPVIQENSTLAERYGELQSVELSYFGHEGTVGGSRGRAKISFVVEGTERSGVVRAHFQKAEGRWSVTEVEAIK